MFIYTMNMESINGFYILNKNPTVLSSIYVVGNMGPIYIYMSRLLTIRPHPGK